MKIITVLGARPQFIKAAAVSRVMRDQSINELIIHTGQHFDTNMSDVFFTELDIPKPAYNLGIHSSSHGAMTGRMIETIEEVLISEKPDFLLVYGDTNSTIAGALAAIKLGIKIAHVEAGLRSFNNSMPEEINRIVTDRISSLLFCPTKLAVKNLYNEGLTSGVHNVGDVMYDVALYYKEAASEKNTILGKLAIEENAYVLATCHRQENTDDPNKLEEILSALANLSEMMPVVLPLHPRTNKKIQQFSLSKYLNNLLIVEPLSFYDFIALEMNAKLIITDSGGVQKEAFFYRVPCITTRDETEWEETVNLGLNALCGASREKIILAANSSFNRNRDIKVSPYGEGDASVKILELLCS